LLQNGVQKVAVFGFFLLALKYTSVEQLWLGRKNRETNEKPWQ
jgi:hypothetical protein